MLGEAYQRHLVFFNTQAVWGGGIISGITVSLEEERAKALNAGEDAVDASVIQNTKIGLMGPLAGIGDSIDSGTVQYIFIALFLGLAQEGNPLGAILPFVCFATATFIYGYLFTKMGYSMRRCLVNLTQNPNVAATLLVGLGCETTRPYELLESIKQLSDKPVEILTIQECGGSVNAIARGTEIARGLVIRAARAERPALDPSQIVLGTNCGGSDATSGLAANPAIGIVSDAIVESGGTVMDWDLQKKNLQEFGSIAWQLVKETDWKEFGKKQLKNAALTGKRLADEAKAVKAMRSRSGLMLMGSPADLMAFATSLRPLPVTTETTVASFGISPSSQAFLRAAVPVTPAGSPNTPQVRPSSRCAARISSSVTFTARPPDSRMAMV